MSKGRSRGREKERILHPITYPITSDVNNIRRRESISIETKYRIPWLSPHLAAARRNPRDVIL